MPDLLIRGIDPEIYKRMRKTAKAEGKSLAKIAREVFRARFKPPKDELLVEARRIRSLSPYTDEDSTALIREDRDNDEPYR